MNTEIKLEISELLLQLVSAQRTIDRLEQLGYRQKTVKDNLSMLIDGVCERVKVEVGNDRLKI